MSEGSAGHDPRPLLEESERELTRALADLEAAAALAGPALAPRLRPMIEEARRMAN